MTPHNPQPVRLLDHYRKLWFFAMNRYKGDNYQVMREYFAGIAIADIEEFIPLWDKKVLDVGGARGEFCKIFHDRRRCDATNLDPDPAPSFPAVRGDRNPVAADQWLWPQTIIATADKIPLPDGAFDVVMCRGVLEHIPPADQLPSMRELRRVTRPGGFCWVVIPPWFSFHAGHGLKPFHLLPFPAAKFLRELVFRKMVPAASYADAGLFSITFRRMLRLIRESGFRLLATRDTHFRLHWLTRIPVVREVLVPAAAFMLTPK